MNKRDIQLDTEPIKLQERRFFAVLHFTVTLGSSTRRITHKPKLDVIRPLAFSLVVDFTSVDQHYVV